MPTTLPYITDDQASAELRAQFGEVEKVMGNVPPMLRILANVPPTVPAFMDFAGPVLMGPNLSIDLKALALLRTSELNDCNYCRGYYAELAKQVGLVGDRRTALEKDEPPAGLFNDRESIVFQLATEMTRDVQARPETVARANTILGIGGTLEAMLTIGLFNLINRVARSSGLPLES
jgi:alkylhydroperoxidase family enzyme